MVSHQSASSSSELFGPSKTSLETQGLFLALIKTIGEIFSLGIENRCAAGPFLVTYQGNIAVKLCGLIPWMAYSNRSISSHMSQGHLKVNMSQIDLSTSTGKPSALSFQD